MYRAPQSSGNLFKKAELLLLAVLRGRGREQFLVRRREVVETLHAVTGEHRRVHRRQHQGLQVGEVERMGAEWELHYGGRARSSMAFLDELSPYGDRVHVVTEEADGILDLDGILGTARAETLVYACGPEGLLGAVEGYAGSWPDGAIRLERFKAKEIPADTLAGDRPVRVICERSGISATVAPDRTILDTLEESGVDVPNSCREGISGTCETRVLAGTPDHRDSLLSSSEQESGTTIMICVSRARSDELVLDL